MSQFSHVDKKGKASMVDVGQKPVQERIAIAKGFIKLMETTLGLIRDNQIKKGDVFTVAEIAGVQAAKQTSHLIPLCHPLLINSVSVECRMIAGGVEVLSTVKCSGKTGVEMEALTAVSVALLAIYDMCKSVDKNMIIGQVELLEKRRG